MPLWATLNSVPHNTLRSDTVTSSTPEEFEAIHWVNYLCFC